MVIVIIIITMVITIIITSLWSRSWLWWCRYEGAGCGLSGALQGCKVIFKFLIFHHFPFVWTPNWRVLIIRQLQIFSASQSRHLYCVLQSLWFYTGETGIGIISIPIECLNLVFESVYSLCIVFPRWQSRVQSIWRKRKANRRRINCQ